MFSVGWAWGEGEGNKLRVTSFVIVWNSVVMECQIRGNCEFV